MKFLLIFFLATLPVIKVERNMLNDQGSEVPKVLFDSNNQLIIKPSLTSSKDDFDFFQGKFKIRNKKLKSRFNNSEEWAEFESTQEMYKVLRGIGNIDNFLATIDGEPFEGMTVRLFNPETRLWSLYWADSNRGVFDPPVVGSFNGDIGYFFTKDVLNGKDIIVVFRWDKSDENKPVWSQAFSDDNGNHWEWNWYMYMIKVK